MMPALSHQARAAFAELFVQLAIAFENEGRGGGIAVAESLRSAASRPYRRTDGAMAPDDLLDASCTLPDALSIASLAMACRNHIDWTHWKGEGLAETISAGLYSTELVGPDGHFDDPDIRVGLLLSAAHTDYPLSSHSGEETYLVIAGVAEWIVAGTSYTAKPPGTLVHHPAWSEHGRRTLEQPFLGAWRWSGDLDLSSFRVA